jgi:acyl dehydratase
MALSFDSITVGDELPVLTKTPGREQLVKYAAGSGDFNPLHYDAEFEQAKAIGDNIVHGRMKYASLGQVVSDWVGHAAEVSSISCQYRGMDLQGKTFTVGGTVTAKDESARTVSVDVWTKDANGAVTTPGKATLRFR